MEEFQQGNTLVECYLSKFRMSQKKMHEVNELLLPSYSWATIVMAWWFVSGDGGGRQRTAVGGKRW